MRVQFSWVIALLLAGCQLTQPLSQNTSETNEENTPASQVTPPTKPKKTPVVVAPKVLTPQEQDDVWQRIAMQLQLPIPDDKTVDYYRTWYIKHPGHLEIVAKRAEPFLYLITEKIEQRNLPLELALLPIVESSFDAFAYS
ncbi:lytic transglycosylase, partial [Vibrio alginolyticus]|nr:lytic transglycosylase [Vibrio alginolyticus]